MNFQIFGTLLALLMLSATLSSTLVLKTSLNDKKLSNYVCKVTKDISKSKTDTQDVLVVNLGGKLWSSTVNDVAGCVGDDNAVVISDFREVIKEEQLWKAEMAILMFDKVTKNMLTALLSDHIQATNWNHLTKVLCIVKATASFEDQFSIIRALLHYGFLNFVIIRQVQNDIETLLLSHLPDKLIGYKNELSINKIFPDKLLDLNGYPYRIVIYHQKPRVLIENGRFTSYLAYFIVAVAKIQNARVQYTAIDDYRKFAQFWLGRHMDLTFNTGVRFPHVIDPKLLTYEENGYCALVPLPPKVPLFQSIFIEPFDGLTWLFLVLTVACCVAVWWMFGSRGAVDSPWHLAYGIFVMFIGQGVDFSRKNRLVLAILLQLIIVMIWILNQAYEGVITSFMIQPIHEHRLETFDDLVTSDFDIMADETFAQKIQSSNSYQSLKSRLNTSAATISDNFINEIERKHFVFVLTCDQVAGIMERSVKDGTKVSDHYYLLKDKFLPYFEQLEASYFNPFIERFQYYMDLSFQAGLLHIWKVFTNSYRTDNSNVKIEANQNLLMLEDLLQAFYVLIFGCLLSIVMFLVEIFFHDILQALRLSYIVRNLSNRVYQLAFKDSKQPKHPKYQKGALYYIIHRRKKVKRLKARKLKVRRIYVQPRFPMD